MGAAKNSKELESLKEQAKELGISFSPNIGLKALQDKVNLALAKTNNEPKEEPKEVNSDVMKTLSGMRAATRLHRVIVNCLHPDKVNYKVELISVGNTKYGFVTRAIPFGTPWHVEEIIYQYLKNKIFYHTTVKDVRENGIIKKVIIHTKKNMYEVKDLPPLTPEEIEQLALDQSASGRIRDDLDN